MDRGIDVELKHIDKTLREASQKWLVGVAAKWRSRLRAMKAVNTGNLLRSIKPVVITAPEALTASLQFPFYGLPLHYGTHIIGVTRKAKKNVGKSSRTYFYGEKGIAPTHTATQSDTVNARLKSVRLWRASVTTGVGSSINYCDWLRNWARSR